LRWPVIAGAAFGLRRFAIMAQVRGGGAFLGGDERFQPRVDDCGLFPQAAQPPCALHEVVPTADRACLVQDPHEGAAY
jgi:hypothetical protein